MNNMATVSKRGNSYRIRCSCGYDTNGKQVMKSKTWKPEKNMTQKQVEKELKRQTVLFEEECQGNQVQGGSVKFQTFAAQWFEEYAKMKLKERTRERYTQLSRRTYAAIGHLKLDKINTRQIQAFINQLGQDGINQRTGGGLSPKTIKHYLSFVSTIFDYAIRMGIVKENPCKHVILPEQAKTEKQCYTIEETQTFLQLLECEPLKYQVFFILAIYGGFRRAELLGLEWSDIDFQNNTIEICRSSLYTKEKGVYTDTPKTAKSSRILKVPQQVILLLKQYKKQQNQERLRAGDKWNITNRLFVNWNGMPMNPGTPYEWLKRFCDRNQLNFYGVHAFRHLNASLLIHSGVDIRTVSAALGHSNTTTTLNIYAHTFAQTQARASQAIAEVLKLKAE